MEQNDRSNKLLGKMELKRKTVRIEDLADKVDVAVTLFNKAQQKFEKGLERTIQWYLENQEWVKEVITGEYQEYYKKVYRV